VIGDAIRAALGIRSASSRVQTRPTAIAIAASATARRPTTPTPRDREAAALANVGCGLRSVHRGARTARTLRSV